MSEIAPQSRQICHIFLHRPNEIGPAAGIMIAGLASDLPTSEIGVMPSVFRKPAVSPPLAFFPPQRRRCAFTRRGHEWTKRYRCIVVSGACGLTSTPTGVTLPLVRVNPHPGMME